MTLIETYTDLFLQISNQIKENCSIKGNVLLSNLLKSTARSTRDLDMSVYSKELYSECVVPELEKFANSFPNTTYTIRDITETHSGGITIKDSSNKVLFKVDVSLSSKSLAGAVLYSFSGEEAYGSSVEKILCDKCITTLSEKRYRRIKDFYDIYIIISSSMVYNPKRVLDLMIEKVGVQEVLSLFNNIPFDEDSMSKLNHAWNKLELHNAFTGERLEKTPFRELVVDVYNFYDRVRLS